MYWYFYVVRCCDHSLYAGVTTDLNAQLVRDNAGTGSKYTRLKRPVRLTYWERTATKKAALRREAVFKKFDKGQKERLVLGERGAQIVAWEGIEGVTRPAKRSGRSTPE
jgi:putative endonuclease